MERLHERGREYCSQVVVDRVTSYESTSGSRVVDISPEKDWITMISKASDLSKREDIKFYRNLINYRSFIRNSEERFYESVGSRFSLNDLIQNYDEAKATIVLCALLKPGGGYRKASELPEEAFVQKLIVAYTFIDKILIIRGIEKTDPDNLGRLFHDVQICDLTLRQMNHISDLNSTKAVESAEGY